MQGWQVSQKQQLRKEKQRQVELRLRAATILQTYVCSNPRLSSSLYVLAGLCAVYVRTAARANVQFDAVMIVRWTQLAEKLGRVILDACAHAAAAIKKGRIASALAAATKTGPGAAATALAPSTLQGRGGARVSAAVEEAEMPEGEVSLVVGAGKSHSVGLEAAAQESALQLAEGVRELLEQGHEEEQEEEQQLVYFIEKTADKNIIAFWSALLAWRRQRCAAKDWKEGCKACFLADVSSPAAAVAPNGAIMRKRQAPAARELPRKNRSSYFKEKYTLSPCYAAVIRAATFVGLPPLIVNMSTNHSVKGLESISHNVRVAGSYDRSCCEANANSHSACITGNSGDESGRHDTDVDSSKIRKNGGILVSIGGTACMTATPFSRKKRNYEFEASDMRWQSCCDGGATVRRSQMTTAAMEICLHKYWCAAELSIAQRSAEVMEICRKARQLQQKATAERCQQACLAVLLHLFRVEQQTAAFYQLLAASVRSYWAANVSVCCGRPRLQEGETPPVQPVGAKSPQAEERLDSNREGLEFQIGNKKEYTEIRGPSIGDLQGVTWPGSAATQLLTAGIMGWAGKSRSSKQQHLDGLFFRFIASKRAELLQFVDFFGAATLADRFFVKRECLALATTVLKKQGHHFLMPTDPEEGFCRYCSAVPEGKRTLGQQKEPSFDGNGIEKSIITPTVCLVSNENRGLTSKNLASSGAFCGDGASSAAFCGGTDVHTRRKVSKNLCKHCTRSSIEDGRKRQQVSFPHVVLDIPVLPWGRSGDMHFEQEKNQTARQVQEETSDTREARVKYSFEIINEGGYGFSSCCRGVTVKEQFKEGGRKSSKGEEKTDCLVGGRGERLAESSALEARLSKKNSDDFHVGVQAGKKDVRLQQILQQLTQMTLRTMGAERAKRERDPVRGSAFAAQRKALQKELLKTFLLVLQAVVSHRTKLQQQQRASRHGRDRAGEVKQEKGERNPVLAKSQGAPGSGGVTAAQPMPAAQEAYAAVAQLQASSNARQLRDAAGRILRLFEDLTN